MAKKISTISTIFHYATSNCYEAHLDDLCFTIDPSAIISHYTKTDVGTSDGRHASADAKSPGG